MLPPVIKTIDVACSPQKAFDVFTRDIGKWWPRDRNSVSAMDGHVARSVTLGLHEGGEIIEIGYDGTRHRWGTVKVFEPGERLTLAWHINLPETQATTVEVTFSGNETGTRVELSHWGWEAFGDRADAMRQGYESGWVSVFEQAYRGAIPAIAA